MPIKPSIQGSASAASTSVAIPAHAVGDLIVIFAFKDGATSVPTKPTAGGTVPAWNDIDAATGANTCASRTAWFIATATNHTTGTWTGATGIIAIVLRATHPSAPIGQHAESGSTGNGTSQAPAMTGFTTDGAAQFLEFIGHRTVTAWGTAPSGYTRQTSVATEVELLTKDTTTTDGAVTQSITSTNSGYRGAAVEVLPIPAVTKSLTASYSVKAQIAKTLAPSYLVKVKKAGVITWAHLSIPYSAGLANVQKSLAASYTVKAPITKSLAASYTVKAPIIKQLTANYTVRFAPVKSLVPTYNVRVIITKSLTAGNYVVHKTIPKSLAVTYTVAGGISKSLAANYNVRAFLSKSFTPTYNKRVILTKTGPAAAYTVRGAITKTLSPSYSVISNVGRRGIITWAHLNAPAANAPVQKSLAASYTVKAPITKSVTSSYTVKAPVTKNLAASYLVRITLGKVLTAGYTVKQPVTKSLAASYVVRFPVVKSLAPSYKVITRVTKSLTANYAITSGGVTKTLTASYNVIKQITKSFSSNYIVHAAVVKSVAASYKVKILITKSLTANYNVPRGADRRGKITWAHFQAPFASKITVSKLLVVSYLKTVKTPVVKSLSVSYGVAGPTTKSLVVRWATNKTGSRGLLNLFVSGVGGTVQKSLTANYTVKRSIAKST